MVLHKKDIIDKIFDKTGFYKKDIKEMINAFKDILFEELQKDNEIVLRNMFSIKMVETKAGNRYNPVLDIYEYRDEKKRLK